MFSVRLSVEVVDVGVRVGVGVGGGAVEGTIVEGAGVEVGGCVIVGAAVVVEVGVDKRYDPHPVTAATIIISNSEDKTYLRNLTIETSITLVSEYIIQIRMNRLQISCFMESLILKYITVNGFDALNGNIEAVL